MGERELGRVAAGLTRLSDVLIDVEGYAVNFQSGKTQLAMHADLLGYDTLSLRRVYEDTRQSSAIRLGYSMTDTVSELSRLLDGLEAPGGAAAEFKRDLVALVDRLEQEGRLQPGSGDVNSLNPLKQSVSSAAEQWIGANVTQGDAEYANKLPTTLMQAVDQWSSESAVETTSLQTGYVDSLKEELSNSVGQWAAGLSSDSSIDDAAIAELSAGVSDLIDRLSAEGSFLPDSGEVNALNPVKRGLFDTAEQWIGANVTQGDAEYANKLPTTLMQAVDQWAVQPTGQASSSQTSDAESLNANLLTAVDDWVSGWASAPVNSGDAQQATTVDDVWALVEQLEQDVETAFTIN